ncbi:MAG: uroporphyrinogen-III synthase, partial [Bradymonadaceae bacterium]
MTYPDPIKILYTGTRPPDHDGRAAVIHLPMLAARPIAFDIDRLRMSLETPATFVFYSRHSARIIVESKLFEGSDLSAHKFWAVGQKTAAYLEAHLNISVSSPRPEHFQALAQDLEKSTANGVIRAFSLAGSSRDLEPVANAHGVAFEEVPVYETTRHIGDDPLTVLARERPRWIALTSPRGVDALVDALMDDPGLEALEGRRLAAIGPTTAAAIRA